MERLIFLFLFGYAASQYTQTGWQYGAYPRYGYVYGGVNSYKLAESTQKVPFQQTIANYYQPGSVLNPLNLARPLSPTNVKVVDYNSLDEISRRQLSQANGQFVSKTQSSTNFQTIPSNHALNPQMPPQQRQISHPGLKPQYRNNPIQEQQKQLELQQTFQRQLIEQANKQSPQALKVTNTNQPMINYPIQGFIVDKPRNQQRPFQTTFQSSNPRFGSSYLPSGAGRVEQLRGSLGGEKPVMDWIHAKTHG